MALLLIPLSLCVLPISKPLTKTPISSIQSLTSSSSKLPSFLSKPTKFPKTLTPVSSSSFGDFTIDLGDVLPDDYSPWDGAVVYKRDASAPHVEYCTTLERLGLAKLSSGVSKSTASAMGIRLPPRKAKAAELGGGDGTPVLVSVDVTRRNRRLKLDGIIRTVITLPCNRCGEPAAQSVFSNFSLLLTEDPIEDSDDKIDIVIYGEDKSKSTTSSRIEEEEDDEKEIDPEDKFYFPHEEKEIDISKSIRDLVHLEIIFNAICDANCKGMCLKCGTNLNKGHCNCSKEEGQDGNYGPLKNVRKQMQQR